MHELSIAQNILEIVDETLSKNQYKKLLEIKVQIGELIAIVPESLRFCYECLIKDSPYAGSKINIEVIPVKIFCKNCKKNYKIKELFFICPVCHKKNVELIQGKELKISHLEVD